MNYTIDELIGMLNLGVIVANGTVDDHVHISTDAAMSIITYLEDLKALTSA